MGARLCAALCVVWMAGCVAHGVGDGPDRAPAPFDPTIRITTEGERSAAPLSLTASDGTGLSLRALTAQVVVEPPLAFTQLELAFENTQARRLEGRFEIALPPGATISRLALQVGENYQEGEVVERQRAHVAYEQALHQKRDPALLERDGGNEYRVRVFPIEARATKHLIVSYSQLLGGQQDPYRLRLQGLPKIGRVRVEVNRISSLGDNQPELFTREAWQPTGDLLVPTAEQPTHSALRHGDLALLHVTPLTLSEPAPIERLTVLLDTSASAHAALPGYLKRLRALTAALAELRGEAIPVQLLVFDQETVPLLTTRSDRLGDELEALLDKRGTLGATDLHGALAQLSSFSDLGDRLWIFSDGVATAGATDALALAQAAEALAESGVQRLDVISPASILDRRLLDALVTARLPQSGVVVTDDDVDTAVRRLTTRTADDMEVQVPGAAFTYPETLSGVEAGERYAIFAQLAASEPLRVKLGDHEVEPVSAETRAGTLLTREWTRAKIAYLQHKLEGTTDTDAQRVRAKIVELSQRHRVLSDYTALVVLETDRDYRMNGIARTELAKILVVEGGQVVAAGERQPVQDTLFHEPWLQDAAREPGVRRDTVGQLGTRTTGAAPRPPTGEGAAPTAALGALMGDSLGSSQGFGGVRGLGIQAPGGGGRGGGRSGAEATPGLGNIGAMGFGDARPLGNDHGHGAGGFRGRMASVPRVRAGKADVHGSLSKEVLRRVIQRHMNEVRFCYEQALRSGPLEGRVEIKFLISPDGGVRFARVARSTLGHGQAENCIANAVQRWQFPAPEGGGIVVVTYPFILQRAGSTPPREVDGLGDGERELRAQRAQRARQARERARQAELRRQRWARIREWRDRPRPTSADHLDGRLLVLAAQIDSGEVAAALASARTWQREAPRDPLALIGLARAAHAAGRSTLAARAHGSLIDLFPSRADYRRAAGQRLEALGEGWLALAVDSYRKAVALRPDHPSGHRLLGYALLRAGKRDEALAALRSGQTQRYPGGRFPGVEGVLLSDQMLINGSVGHSREMVRMCLYWETDATDMDLHVYDRGRRHAHSGRTRLGGGGQLETSVRDGYGPECFTAKGSALSYPYLLQAHYRSTGAMGHALAALHIVHRDGDGQLTMEMRPFVAMKDGARIPLGSFEGAPPVLASAQTPGDPFPSGAGAPRFRAASR